MIHCPIPSLIQKPVLLLDLWSSWVGVELTGRWGSLRSLASLKPLQEASSLLVGGPLGLSSWESPVVSLSHSTDLIRLSTGVCGALSLPSQPEPNPRSSWLCWELPDIVSGQSCPDVAGVPGRGLASVPSSRHAPSVPTPASTTTCLTPGRCTREECCVSATCGADQSSCVLSRQ